MSIRRKSDKASTRGHNRRLILNCLRQEAELSRVDLIEMTGLAASTVTIVVAELQTAGFIVEREKGQSSGGRRPVLLAIDYARHQAIGIKLMHDRIDATLTDLATAPLGGMSVALADHEPDAIADKVAVLCTELLAASQTDPGNLVGIGLALPGFIDAERGVCIDSPRFGWTDVPIASLVSQRTRYPVRIDNDVNAYAIAHQLFGAAMSKTSLVAVVVGVGLGAAIITAGGLHRGWRFRAGEIGFVLDDPGPAALAQSVPSWGQTFSEVGLLSKWSAVAAAHGLSDIDLFEACARQVAPAIELLGEFGRALGWRIATLVEIFDPEAVVLGGETVRFGVPLLGPLLSSYQTATGGGAAEILIDRDNDIWTRGAAALAIQSFFASTDP